MTHSLTLNDLHNDLGTMPQDAPLVFTTEAGPIGGGYHVTELKLSDITSIDCGGRVSSWQETALQLLDVKGTAHMSVGKFLAIAVRSRDGVKGLGNSALVVEFAHGNSGKQIYTPGRPALTDDTVVVPLRSDQAMCKPAVSVDQAPAACCPDQPAINRCCG